MKTLNTPQILSIYTSNSGVKMRSLTQKHRLLIEEFKFSILNGWEKMHAIDFLINDEYSYSFNDQNEKDLIFQFLVKIKS